MKEINTEDLKHLLDRKENFILLDCRGVDYYLWEHLPKAKNLRWKHVAKDASKVLPDKKALIVTYCDGMTCGASIRCYNNLKKEGYTNLLEYSGGLITWKAHGLETIKNPNHRIADNVYRFPNQTFYGEAVNSYLIEEEDAIVLVDGPQHLTDEHEDFIVRSGKPIKVFISHNPTAGETEKLQKKYKAKIYLHEDDRNGPWLTVKPNVLVKDGYRLSKNLTVIHTPGHSPGSSVLYDSKNKMMFTGDHVEGDENGNIHDYFKHRDGYEGNVKERLTNTKKLLSYDFDQILPFHYEMIRKDAKKILKNFIAQKNSL